MRADTMWRQFGSDADYTAWSFGGAPDELAALARDGIKTATASAYPLYAQAGEPLPAEGNYSVILDAAGEAVCVIRTTRVYLCAFREVSALHAWKEGEGDRTLRGWREVHRAVFSEELRAAGLSFSEEMPVVCEEFSVVFPAPDVPEPEESDVKSARAERLFQEMFAWFAGDPEQIQHFVKVHSFSRRIGLAERLDARTQQILEAAAIVHDVGIRPSREKYASGAGNYQELEGPPVAAPMLAKAGYAPDEIDRACYLVGHHHTYSDVDGMDYQVLLEADFLVNLYEEGLPAGAVDAALKTIFRTPSGTKLCREMFQGR